MQIELDAVIEDALMGNPEAYLHLAYEYTTGTSLRSDLKLAWLWTKKASDEGSSFASLMLGYMYYKGEGVTQNLREAARILKKVAKEQPHAWHLLGVMYMNGMGVRKRYKKAIRCFSLASSSLPTSYFWIGLLTEWGARGKASMVKVHRYYEIAANGGSTIAMSELAKIHAVGADVPKDVDKAIEYLKTGVKLGDSHCKEVLVYLLIQRGDNANDGTMAFQYAKELSSSGSYFGKLLLSKCYEKAFGTKQDKYLEEYWREQAENDYEEE